jgi:hypothetical protein
MRDFDEDDEDDEDDDDGGMSGGGGGRRRSDLDDATCSTILWWGGGGRISSRNWAGIAFLIVGRMMVGAAEVRLAMAILLPPHLFLQREGRKITIYLALFLPRFVNNFIHKKIIYQRPKP